MQKTKQPTKEVAESPKPRIKPIDNPKSIKLKLAYWFTEKQMGKVITPLKVIQARMPDTLSLSQKMMKIEDNLSLPDDLIFYIKSYVSTLNGCSFCIDLAKHQVKNEDTIQKYEELLNFKSSNAFTEAEKAALTYVKQATQNKEVTDEAFENLKHYYSDSEIVEITWLNALQNYYNLLTRPLQVESDNLCNL